MSSGSLDYLVVHLFLSTLRIPRLFYGKTRVWWRSRLVRDRESEILPIIKSEQHSGKDTFMNSYLIRREHPVFVRRRLDGPPILVHSAQSEGVHEVPGPVSGRRDGVRTRGWMVSDPVSWVVVTSEHMWGSKRSNGRRRSGNRGVSREVLTNYWSF